MNVKLSSLFACSAAGALLLGGAETALAQAQPPADHPAVTVHGQTYTPASILARNMGSEADRVTQFPPHKIIGNIYYVGTRTLSSFLITTPQGDILIDTTYERNAPVIEKSIMDLGFKLSDVKIILGTHAHGDHQEGDAVFKQKTGAQFVAMAEDVPLLKAMKPEGKEHPVDRIIHDGDSVTLGGTTLVAHLTPGHTPGCTSWTTAAQEGGANVGWPILGEPRWTLTGLPSNIVQVIEIGFLLLGFAGSLVVTHGLAEEDSPGRPLRAFVPWATVCLVLWMASMWLVFQPMEMRATLMSG